MFAALDLNCIAAIARWSFANSWIGSKLRYHPAWTFISSWTITARTKRRSSGSGWPKRPRLHADFTSTYGSWINLVERWFAELTNKRIRRGVFRSVKDLESGIREYIELHNQDLTPFVWTKSADEILVSIARYAQRTLAAHSA